MGLFTPAWKSKDPWKARQAVRECTDQKKLALIAEKAEIGQVRREAAKKLTELWRSGDEKLRPAVQEANRWSITSHWDNGSGSCHSDDGPMTIVFS